MKKGLFLLAVLAITAVTFVNAQDSVTWVANDFAVEAGLAFDDVALLPGTETVVGPVTFTATDGAETGWKYKSNEGDDFLYNGVTYSRNLFQGQTNPKNGRPTDGDGNPAAASVWEVTKDGRLDITLKVAPRKRLWVIAIPTADLVLHDIADSAANAEYKYSFADGEFYWSGYIDPATNPPSYYEGSCLYESDPEGDEYTYFSGLSLDVEATKTYYVFVSGSKLQMCGFTFVEKVDPGTSISSTVSNATVVSTEYYTILGQKVAQPREGELNIIVNTMSDGTRSAEKVYINK